VCGNPVGSRPPYPTFTEWTFGGCAEATDADFVNFFDDAYACQRARNLPNTIVGPESCMRTTNQANDGERWSLQFTDWCANATQSADLGCFSLVRWKEVADGEACSP
jgi:hypothetical protein